eukprot:6545092-Pyramimonas_sp.AAC.1
MRWRRLRFRVCGFYVVGGREAAAAAGAGGAGGAASAGAAHAAGGARAHPHSRARVIKYIRGARRAAKQGASRALAETTGTVGPFRPASRRGPRLCPQLTGD